MLRIALVLALTAGALAAPEGARAEEQLATFTLDAFSTIAFGDEVLIPDAGSTLTFRFGDRQPDGSVPFTIRPEDVAIAPVRVPSGGTLLYTLAAPASGTWVPTLEGPRIAFTATVRARLEGPNGNGSFDYTLPFTTESVTAQSADGSDTRSVTGLRLVPGAGYARLVGATTNRENAFPAPGTAVTTVLSGSFDRVP